MKSLATAILVSLPLVTSTALAQEDAPEVVYATSGWQLGIGQVSLDSQTALEEGVEDSATYLRLGWERQGGSWLFGVGLSGYLYDDNAGFSQRVEDLSGDESTADSSAQAFSLYGETGYILSMSENASFDIIGGVEAVLTSDRSIPNCSDCASEDIDISSGFYLGPRFRVVANNGFTFTMNYYQYLSGDVDSMASVSFGMTY